MAPSISDIPISLIVFRDSLKKITPRVAEKTTEIEMKMVEKLMFLT
jgi:hypothetical protein